MAAQNRRYIELNEISSLRFDCTHKGCGGSLSVPFAVDIAKLLSNCPKCGEEWAGSQGGTNIAMIHDFTGRLDNLIGQAKLANFNFQFYLEIAPDAARVDTNKGT